MQALPDFPRAVKRASRRFCRTAIRFCGSRASSNASLASQWSPSSMSILICCSSKGISPVTLFFPVSSSWRRSRKLPRAACSRRKTRPARSGSFAGIDKAKFREQVRPGDTIRLEANITRNSSRMCVAEVKAYKGDKLCAQAMQKYVLAKNEMQ